MTQRRSPRNLSRRSISLLNVEVFEASDMVSRSSQLYPMGGLGPFTERGSGKADNGSMIADVKQRGAGAEGFRYGAIHGLLILAAMQFRPHYTS